MGSPTWRLHALQDVQPQPWRNGAGTTQELLAWPSPADWQLRISVASIEGRGPFSRFRAIERWLAVLDGEGLQLEIDDASFNLRDSSDPIRFDGDAAVNSAPCASLVRVLNLMAPTGRAVMKRVGANGHQSDVEAGTVLALYSHVDHSRVSFGDVAYSVPPLHLGWCVVQQAETVSVRGDNTMFMTIAP